MPAKLVDDRDVQFVLWEQLELGKYLDDPIFKGFGKDDINMIIEEAKKFAETAVYPANFTGDREGVHIVDGVVKAPPSYKPVYDALCEGGWIGLAVPEEYGGQGLTEMAGFPVTEYWMAASIAFSMYPGLTRAAMHLITTCCTPEQKMKYVPNMAAGKWQGTITGQSGWNEGQVTYYVRGYDTHNNYSSPTYPASQYNVWYSNYCVG